MQYQPYSQGTNGVIFPVARSIVFGNEGVFAYHLWANFARRWQTCRLAAGSLDNRYRKAWKRQAEMGKSLESGFMALHEAFWTGQHQVRMAREPLLGLQVRGSV